jgi:hypothetical protein
MVATASGSMIVGGAAALTTTAAVRREVRSGVKRCIFEVAAGKKKPRWYK